VLSLVAIMATMIVTLRSIATGPDLGPRRRQRSGF
jgi:hypothetical protein